MKQLKLPLILIIDLLISYYSLSQNLFSKATFFKDFKNKYSNVNGVNLHYVTGGKGETLLFIHGNGATWYSWRKIMPKLVAQYSLVVPDLRGFGESSKPDSGYDKKTLATDIYFLLQKLNVNKVSIVAHDFGVPIAYALASMHPELINKMILIEGLPALPLKDGECENPFWLNTFNQIPVLPDKLIKGKEKIYLSYLYNLFSFNKQAFSEEDINEYTKQYSKSGSMNASFALYRTRQKDINDNKTFISLPLNMPILAIGGDHSFGSYVYQTFKQLGINVSEKVLESSGHYAPEENPAALLKEIKSFLLKN
jgi:pimeloyl-ACP methyl ester carboxylesterase